jgi:hypothetical protein
VTRWRFNTPTTKLEHSIYDYESTIYYLSFIPVPWDKMYRMHHTPPNDPKSGNTTFQSSYPLPIALSRMQFFTRIPRTDALSGRRCSSTSRLRW